MKQYSVRYSPRVVDQIYAYADNIARKSKSVEIAERWVDFVYTSIDRLEYNPQRFALAEENDHRDYEIHRQIIGSYLALYSIDETANVVRIIGFRHGRQLPRPKQLPKKVD